MAIRDLWDDEYWRLRLLLAGMMAAFLLLAGALWRIQVAHGQHYQADLLKQSVRRVRIPGLRGRISDRNGMVLADNRPSYCIAVYLEELRQPGRWPRTIAAVEHQLDELSRTLGIPRQITREDIQVHIRKRLPLPLLAWKDISETTLARMTEGTHLTPGFDLQVEPVRVYPYEKMACHMLGYVGRAEIAQEDEERPYHYYLPEMAGKAGVEKHFDNLLRGEAGGRLVRVDVSGFRHDDMGMRDPQNGRDLRLALDVRIQQVAEEALNGRNGAVVVVDPRNGDVLALASAPGFNPNTFIPFIPSKEWAALLKNPDKPLMNRAVAGAFPPGSIFKPVVALAALENGAVTPSVTFNCPGHFELGRARFRCWFTPGHGVLNLQQALQHSCNVYLYHLGLLVGVDPIVRMAAALGLGRKTGISLDYEPPGLLPDDDWKRRTQGDGWRDGDTCNLSIGQGFLLVTPLQMAMMTAAIANGGHVYKPRLLLEVLDAKGESLRTISPSVASELNWKPSNIEVVRKGMKDVVEADRGTGRQAHTPGWTAAGKTGTAEIGRKEEGRKLGWMIAFAPFDQPRYALVVMVEDAMSGGTTAAPLVKKILTRLLELERPMKGEG